MGSKNTLILKLIVGVIALALIAAIVIVSSSTRSHKGKYFMNL